jgi:hypothetical protein
MFLIASFTSVKLSSLLLKVILISLTLLSEFLETVILIKIYLIIIVIDFLITYTLPVVKIIQKAYEAFKLFMHAKRTYELSLKYSVWVAEDFYEFGKNLVGLIFETKNIL